MLENIDGLRMLRNSYFKMLGKKRWMRIITIAFLVGSVWCFADWLSGSLSANLWHDLVCLILAIVIERLLPWGK